MSKLDRHKHKRFPKNVWIIIISAEVSRITSCQLPVITCVKTGSDLRSEVPLALIGSQMVDIGLIFNTNHMGPKWKLRYAKKAILIRHIWILS